MNSLFSKDFLAFRHRDQRVFLVSLLIAFIFWFVIRFSQDYTHNYNFSVEYVLPDTLGFTEFPPESLRAQLSGSGWDLLSFSLKRNFNQFTVRTTDARVTQPQLLHALEDHISNPSIRVDKVLEATLQLQVEENGEKTVPVEPVLAFSIADGHTLREPIRTMPDSIRVRGPISLLAGIERWATEQVEIENISADIKMEVGLEKPENNALTLSRADANLEILVEKLTEKQIDVPVLLRGDSLKTFRIYPEKVRINASVGLSDFARLNEQYFKVVAEVKNNRNTAGRHIPVEVVDFPDFIRGFDYSPKTVEVFVMEENSSTQNR